MNEHQPEEIKTTKPKFSVRRVLVTLLAIIIAGAILGGGWFLSGYRPVRVAWAAMVLNSHENYLPCEELPFSPQVKATISKHQDFVTKLKNAGASSVSAKEIQCPSSDGSFAFLKGYVEIDYHTRQQRQAIEELLGDNFFGMPYRGQPVK